MIASSGTRRATTMEELIPAGLAAALERVDVRSSKMFAGRMQGERRSKQRGRGVEFEDYRPYVLGDDLRHIDWNVAARLDRLFVRVFQEEQDLSVHLIVDASASMEAGTPSKLLLAQRLAMAIGYLALIHNNRVAAWVIGGEGVVGMEPSRGRRSVEKLARFLLTRTVVGEQAGGAAERFAAGLRTIVGGGAGRSGMAVVLSDLLMPGEEGAGRFAGYAAGLNLLSGGGVGGGWDVTLVQILSGGELEPGSEVDGTGTPTIAGDLRLIDAETSRGAEVSVSPALLARYRANLEEFVGGVKRYAAGRGMVHVLARSDADVAKLLLGELRQKKVLK